MPSRITRNSYRPRASDRTMVDTESPVALAALTTLDDLTSAQRKPTRMDHKLNFFREPRTTVGWISRNTLALRPRGEFFLDILFIELIDNPGDLAISNAGVSKPNDFRTSRHKPADDGREKCYCAFPRKL